MKKTLLILFLLACFADAQAKHVTGGEIIYDHLSSSTNSKRYRITLILFRDENCIDPCAVMPQNVFIGVFNNDNNQLIGGSPASGGAILVNRNRIENLPIGELPQCITNPPDLRYTAGYYIFEIDLPNNLDGYTAVYQTCCRVNSTQNINNNVSGEGATYVTNIPGIRTLSPSQIDNSPRFSKIISVVCQNNEFVLDFSATDPDGDQLVYSLCNAYNGGGAINAGNRPPDPPPYNSVDYVNGNTALKPLGPLADINPQTGIISGIAPVVGKYVVSVCVSSFRNGNFIAVHRKDFIMTIAACDFASADLNPEYVTCDGFSFQFSNNSNSPLNQTYYWDFGDPASGANNIRTEESPIHTFSDTGIFTVKFVVNRGTPCSDSTTTRIKVYPGYFPEFINNSPMCKGIPVQFNDQTTATYGIINKWRWDFGVNNLTSDTSIIRNPNFTYSQTGTYTATLIVSSSKGCIDTITRAVTIVDKPLLTVTNDTLMCSADNIQLSAASNNGGSVIWSPNYNINNVNSFTPIVSPDVTTTYFVSYADNFGCRNSDSVKVSVVDTVSLQIGNDTTICRTDGIALPIISNALRYVWTPAGTLDNPTVKSPIATPTALFTTYYVRGNIGTCFDRDSITIKTIPYPVARAGRDTTICFGTPAFLQATGGSFYSWAPATYLNNSNIASPTVINSPAGITNYTVTVRDTLGCPKPVTDVVQLTVDQIIADAGPRDTAIVAGQTLQLNATGGSIYEWTPVTQWLNNPNIFNPVSRPLSDIEYIVRVSNAIGCSDTDSILVKFYTVLPGFFVPSAFSPNGDGLNEVIKPLALGLKAVELFQVYNRWGQQVFSTTQIGEGWNGKYKGIPQEAGSYVWYATGKDYANRKLEKKGTVILIR